MTLPSYLGFQDETDPLNVSLFLYSRKLYNMLNGNEWNLLNRPNATLSFTSNCASKNCLYFIVWDMLWRIFLQSFFCIHPSIVKHDILLHEETFIYILIMNLFPFYNKSSVFQKPSGCKYMWSYLVRDPHFASSVNYSLLHNSFCVVHAQQWVIWRV